MVKNGSSVKYTNFTKYKHKKETANMLLAVINLYILEQ